MIKHQKISDFLMFDHRLFFNFIISFNTIVEQWKRKNRRFFLFHCSTIVLKEIYPGSFASAAGARSVENSQALSYADLFIAPDAYSL
jgi:hypothetical protein